MATSNAQLTKLAIGITAVAALAAITGSLSAGAAPSTDAATANGAPADPAQAQGQQVQSAPQSSGGLFGFGFHSEDDEEEGEEHEHEGYSSRRSPQFAVPGTGTGTNAGTVAPRTRSKHS